MDDGEAVPRSRDEIPSIDLRERGIDEITAAELLWRFSTFTDDWRSPEMDDYDWLP